jgi:hypothetical protein
MLAIKNNNGLIIIEKVAPKVIVETSVGLKPEATLSGAECIRLSFQNMTNISDIACIIASALMKIFSSNKVSVSVYEKNKGSVAVPKGSSYAVYSYLNYKIIVIFYYD